jgi:hypothetical protein
LTGLFQLGTDRILVLSFTNDINEERTYHLVLEFFSAGKSYFSVSKVDCSIILVSSKNEILHVLRKFRPNIPPGGDPGRFQVYEIGAHYTTLEQFIAHPKVYESMTMDRLQTILKENVQVDEVEDEEINALMPPGDLNAGKKKKYFKKKKEVNNTIRRALLNGAAEYGAQLVEQIIRISQVDENILINQIDRNVLPTRG